MYRFGEFVLDPRRRTLLRHGSPVVLTPKAFDVLFFLLQNPNRLVRKEELLQGVWGDTFVEDGSLTQYISHLRKALGDTSEDTRLIVTIARRGYQFTADVAVAETEAVVTPVAVQVPGNGSTRGDARRALEFPTKQVLTKPSRRWPKTAFVASSLLAVIAAAFWFYWSYSHRVTLSATDTIVLADVANETSDPAFEDALNTALRYAMAQTPYLNVLGIDKVFGTLGELNLPPRTKLTPETARQVCLRTHSKLVIASSIADAGVRYRIELRATDCQSGREVRIREEAADRNQVVHVFGVAATQLRRKLGEPAASLARFNQPLEEALSSSVDALQVGTMGYQRHLAGDLKGAITYYQRALELDPDLAPTYEGLVAAYDTEGEMGLAVAALTRAYALRDRMTEPSRLETEYLYYSEITGELDKALSVLVQTVQTFPRNVTSRMNLYGCLDDLGRPDKAADEVREAARLQPTALTYSEWALGSLHAEWLNETQAVLDEAAVRKFDNFKLQHGRTLLAFLRNDQRTLQQQWDQPIGRQDAVELLLLRSEIEEYYGRFRAARKMIQKAYDTAPGTADEQRSKISGWKAEPRYALWETESGDPARARQIAAAAIKTVSNRDEKPYLALALARAGDIEQARKMADALDRDAPLDTLVQNYHLPTIRAAIKLSANDPAGAIAALQTSLKYELSYNHSFNGLYPAYIRGLAYLELGEGRLAAAEFQKLFDHKGLVGTDVIGALAHLQMARTQKMMGDEASARKWYEQFLALWRDADPDIPVLKQAKSEYAKLRK